MPVKTAVRPRQTPAPAVQRRDDSTTITEPDILTEPAPSSHDTAELATLSSILDSLLDEASAASSANDASDASLLLSFAAAISSSEDSVNSWLSSMSTTGTSSDTTSSSTTDKPHDTTSDATSTSSDQSSTSTSPSSTSSSSTSSNNTTDTSKGANTPSKTIVETLTSSGNGKGTTSDASDPSTVTVVQPQTTTVAGKPTTIESTVVSIVGGSPLAPEQSPAGGAVSLAPMGLSTGALIGIAAGALAALVILIGLCIYCCRRSSSTRRRDSARYEHGSRFAPLSAAFRPFQGRKHAGVRPDNLPEGIDNETMYEPKTPAEPMSATTLAPTKRSAVSSFWRPAKAPSMRDTTSLFGETTNGAGVGAVGASKATTVEKKTMVSRSSVLVSKHDPTKADPKPASASRNRVEEWAAGTAATKRSAAAPSTKQTLPTLKKGPTIAKDPTMPLPWAKPARSMGQDAGPSKTLKRFRYSKDGTVKDADLESGG